MNPTQKDKLDKMKNSVWSFFIEKRAVTWVILIAIIIFGTVSALGMNREIQPEVKIPFGGVVTALPGANPSDTESLITKPLEERIATINNLETMSSTSSFGASSIFVEFTADSDMTENINNLKDAVDLAKSELPEDATDPAVINVEANEYVIIGYSISGSSRTLYDVTQIAEDISSEIEKVSGVSRADILGGQQKVIEVTIDQPRLEGYGLDIQTVSAIIETGNNNLPVGVISSDKLNYSVRIDNRYQSMEEIKNIPLFTSSNGAIILLQDVAEIKEGFPLESIISKFSLKGTKSQQAVSIQVYKKESADIVTTVEKVRERVDELIEEDTIPGDITIGISTDLSVYVTETLDVLTRSGVQTTILITFILFLALGLRQGIIAGLSIPVIFLIAFIIMDAQGLTLNSLSLFSLVIALGLMVDTTIIIMEGIYENLKKGASPKEAALISVHTYKWPIIAGTLTTVFAFFPMLLISGILGEFLKTLPITISAVLLGSLFVSLTIAPSIATKFAKKKEGKKYISILEPIFDNLGKKFHKIVRYIIEKQSLRTGIIISAIALFAISISLPITGVLKVNMFPSTDQYTFVIEIETPKGTILEETREIAEDIEKSLYEIPEVQNFVTNIGTNQTAAGFSESLIPGGGASSDSNIANITVNLTNKEERERESIEIANELRKKLSTYRNASININEFTEGPPSEEAITARITGDNLDTLTQFSEKIEEIMNSTDGTLNVKNSLVQGLNEFKFTLDKDKLSYHGLSSIQVSALTRNIVQGINSTTITQGNDDIDVIVKYNLSEENNRTNISINDIQDFEIVTPKGYSVTLGELGSYELGESLASISREEQKRIIKVTSDTKEGYNAVDITAEIQTEIDKLEMPSGYSVEFGGDLEQIMESLKELAKSMVIAVVLIAFTLILMFNSFKQAIIVLVAIPLSMIGVFPGLLAIGLDVSFPAFLGIVALAGIVVNDEIVLMDRINNNRKSGELGFAESIAEAAEARLQPIFMTSVTTIIGILPLALTDKFWAGLGFALIFGLAFSTILTLVIIPSLYFKLEKRKARKEGTY